MRAHHELGSHWSAICTVSMMAISILLSDAPLRAQPVLRWKFVAGQRLSYRRHQERTIATIRDGKPARETSSRWMDFDLYVDEVPPDGGAELRLAIERIRIETPSARVRYDSDLGSGSKEAGADLVARIREVLDNELQFHMTPRGQISRVRIRRKGNRSTKDSKPAPPGLVGELEQLLPYIELPESSPRPGDTWSDTLGSDDPLLGKRSLSITYHFAGTERRQGQVLDKIESQTTLRLKPQSAGPRRVELGQQKISGVIYVDPETGRPTEKRDSEDVTFFLVDHEQRTERRLQNAITIIASDVRQNRTSP